MQSVSLFKRINLMHPGIQTPGCIVLYAARFYAYLDYIDKCRYNNYQEVAKNAREIASKILTFILLEPIIKSYTDMFSKRQDWYEN